jgi:uncharacterized OsmC-like protein
MSEEMINKVGISLEDQMIFKCDLGSMKVKDLYIDETHKNEEDMLGPNPSRMLGLAILGCLSASFIFCLQKKNLSLEDLKAEAEVIIHRNEKGFWRIKRIDVNIKTIITDPETRKRAEQCRKMYESFCIITQSVRDGIKIDVNLNF